MGITSLFRRNGLVYNAATGQSYGSGFALKSPWANSAHLRTVDLSDVLESNSAVTIAQALSVPPVSRAIGLFSAAISASPLISSDKELHWLDNTAGAVTARHRSVQTVQDLIFTGASLWWKEVKDADGYPMSCIRVPRELWTLDQDGNVCTINGDPLTAEDFIYIPAFREIGFLETGAATIRQYLYLGRQIMNRARSGKPLLDLHITDMTEYDEDELETALEDWTSARLSDNGAVAITPSWLEVRELGATEVSMLSEARNAVRLDVANFLNINAAMLDGDSGTSDNYSNTLQNVTELTRLSLREFMTPIENRLSQDDVTPNGTTITFDTSAYDVLPDAKGNQGTATTASTPQRKENNGTAETRA